MSRGPATFKQSDATRAAKAMLAAGLEVREVVIDRAGNIRMTTQRPGAEVQQDEPDTWAKVVG